MTKNEEQFLVNSYERFVYDCINSNNFDLEENCYYLDKFIRSSFESIELINKSIYLIEFFHHMNSTRKAKS